MPLISTQTSDELIKDLDVLARELERLKGSYEQYFLGLERIEPKKLRAQVLTLIRKYTNVPIQSARPKFRYNQLVQRYNTYTTYWDRVLREIEEGRYERDVFRAKIHEKERGVAPAPADASPERPTVAAPDPLKTVFDEYVEEKRKNNEDVRALSFEKFRTHMAAQIQALQKKLGTSDLKLKVVTEEGKTKIKAIPRQPKPKVS